MQQVLCPSSHLRLRFSVQCTMHQPLKPKQHALLVWLAALTCARASLANGQSILELGCGWGSLSLFMAQAYPGSNITAVSNSKTQKDFIMQRARDLDVKNLEVITADMVDFQVSHTYHNL